MEELGYGNDYYIRFRHIVLQPGEKIEIDAYNQFYILVDRADNLNVSSEFGEFDLSANKTNEQLYEHQGQITIKNYSGALNNVRFIQIIPKHTKCKIIKENEQCQ
ncbi:MAG: hypothetical protein ACT4ON_13240 [Bacteroidota bacterium]